MTLKEFKKRVERYDISVVDIYLDSSIDKYAYNVDIYAGQIDIAFSSKREQNNYIQYIFLEIISKLRIGGFN